METMEKPKIMAIAPWFGSKRNLAPEIVREIGSHTAYWEPFCGSLAVLLAKDAVPFETVNDAHGELINLARVLANEDSAVELYSRLSRSIMHEEMFHEAAARWKARGMKSAAEMPDVDRAAEFMVCSWFGRNGVAGTKSYNQGFCVRYTKNGGHAATRWTSAVDSIPAWHHRLRHVTILNRDAFGVIGRIEDAKGVAMYVDPPYLLKGAEYIHDFEEADHERLAAALSRFRHTRIVVSYYDHPLLSKLYLNWRKRTIEVTRSMANQGKRNKTGADKAIEVLLINDSGQRTIFEERP